MNLTQVRARVRRLVLVSVSTALATATLSLASPPTASAATGFVDVPNAVLYDTCRHIPVRWSIDPTRSYEGWSMTVIARDPRGVETGLALVDSASHPNTGTTAGTDDGMFFCGFEMTGTYRVTAEVTYFEDFTSEYFADTFTLRRPGVRATVGVNDTTASYGQRLRFSTRVTGEFPRGYFALPYERVRIQKRTPSGWRTAASTMTDGKGVARFSLVWRHSSRVAVRVVATPDSPYSMGVSRTIVIR